MPFTTEERRRIDSYNPSLSKLPPGMSLADAIERVLDEGLVGTGDMDAGTYDPQSIEDDAFDPGNHRAVQQGTSSAPTTAGPVTAQPGARVVYDPTGGTFQINAPAAPVAGMTFRVKNASADGTAVTISGNGSNIEDPIASYTLAASFTLAGDGIAVTWEYDGVAWLVV